MDWLDDDPESLGATLAMLAAWDRQATDGSADDSSSNGSVRPASAGSRVAEKPANARAKPTVVGPKGGRSINLSRERQKQETMALRRQMAELEMQLSQLQRARELWLGRRCIAAATREGDGQEDGAQLWAILASRQWKARQKAERLNLHLKAMLKQQMSVADELKRVLLRAEMTPEQAHTLAMLMSTESIPRSPQDAAAEEQLLRRLESICLQWATPFSHCQRFHDYEQFTPRFLEMHMTRDESHDKMLDVFSSSVYPFPSEDVADALWSFFGNEKWGEDEYSWTAASEMRRERDVQLSTFRAALSKDGNVGNLHGQCARKKYLNSDGHIVIATTAYAVPGSDSQLERSHFMLREDSWIRFVNVRELLPGNIIASQQTSTTELSVIQHVRTSRILSTKNLKSSKPDIDELTKLLKQLIIEELVVGEVGIEDLLMRGPTTRPGRDPSRFNDVFDFPQASQDL